MSVDRLKSKIWFNSLVQSLMMPVKTSLWKDCKRKSKEMWRPSNQRFQISNLGDFFGKSLAW